MVRFLHSYEIVTKPSGSFSNFKFP